MASNFTPADREKLADLRSKVETKLSRMEINLKTLQSDSTAALEERIDAGLAILREYKITKYEPVWAAAVRELIEIGKPAVPKLTEELDRTERGDTLRALGFVLRGIGDPRAVPSLIRAIPRTLRSGEGDYGMTVRDDPELTRFMVEHDNDPEDRSGDGMFSWGVPMREILPALEKLTGDEVPREDLVFVSLEGNARQRQMKRALFLKLARRWADWWSEHWRDHVENEDAAQLELIEESLDRYAATISPEPKRSPQAGFPRGAGVVLTEEVENVVIRSFKDESEFAFLAFLDFDTGRLPRPSKSLIEASAEDEPSKGLLDWAEKEGVDLITFKAKNPGGDGFHYAFQPVGMKVWRIKNSRYEKIEDELRGNAKFELPDPWQGPLSLIDEKTGKYEKRSTASYLFITKEGTCGRFQLQGPLHRELTPDAPTMRGGGMRFDFVYEGEKKTPDPLNSSEENSIIPAGVCVDAAGTPVKDAEIVLYKVDHTLQRQKVVARTRTDAQGRFRFDPVPGNPEEIEPYCITATAEGRATQVRFVPSSRSGPDGLRLAMPKAGVLRGCVKDSEGRPVEGAKVFFRSGLPEPVVGVRCAITDEQGNYVINDIEPGSGVRIHGIAGWRVISRKDGAISVTSPPRVSCRHPRFEYTWTPCKTIPGTVDFVVKPAGVIEGRVVYAETGKPAAGVAVGCQSVGKGDYSVVTTDADGRYRLDSLRGEKYNIWPDVEDWTAPAVDSFQAVSGRTRTAPTLKLTRGGIVKGRLIDADTGEPLSREDFAAETEWKGGPHIAVKGPARPLSGPGRMAVSFGPDGTYSMRLPQGEHFVLFRPASPWRRTKPKVASTLNHPAGPEFDNSVAVPVEEGGVIDMDFHVQYQGSKPRRKVKRRETEKKTPDPLNPFAARKAADAALAKTVHGKVVDEEGTPIPGADVWMMPVYDPVKENPAAHVTTDAQGRFTLAVPSLSDRDLKRVGWPYSRGLVLAYADGRQLGTAEANEQMAGHDKSDLIIRLKPAVETEFIVWGPDGKPKAGAIVQPRHINTLGCDPPKEVRARIAAKTDAQGRAVLTAVPREAIASVDVITDDLGIQNQTTHTSGGGGDRAFEVDLPAGQPIQLRPSARIVGRITAEKPEWARGVRIVLHTNPVYRSDRPLPPWPTTGHAEVVSDEQGRFEVPGMAEGALCIIAKVDDRLPVLPVDPDTLIIDLASKPKKTIEVEIPLVRKIPVHGRVRVAKEQ